MSWNHLHPAINLFFNVCNFRTSQKEISKLKTQLQSCMDNAEFVRLLKEELESKSFKYEQLENENESLKKYLEVKVWICGYLTFTY
jgi:cell shape-determining protein MreC